MLKSRYETRDTRHDSHFAYRVTCHVSRVTEKSEQGTGILEVLLAMAIVALLVPFAYIRINEVAQDLRDMSDAKTVISYGTNARGFIREHQNEWPGAAQIKMDEDDLKSVAPTAKLGFIDKYPFRDTFNVDVYFSFDLGDQMRTTKIARDIGGDAAVVINGIAYGDSWAAASPDFNDGNLVYRVRYDVANNDKSKFLHRVTDGEDELNKMQRNLNVGGYDLIDVGTVSVESIKFNDASSAFVSAENLSSDAALFTGGATIDGSAANLGIVRVSDDVSGFREIAANRVNKQGFDTNGSITTDRAVVTKSVHVGRDLIIKSSGSGSISGFAGMSVNSLLVPFISADELTFLGDFGLTLSAELLLSSSDSPLKLGGWTFPEKPNFTEISFGRAQIPGIPSAEEFIKITAKGWKYAK